MKELAMYFDVTNRKWQPLEDEACVTAEIEDLPYVFVMRYDDELWVWCARHREFERLYDASGMDIVTRKGCKMHGLPACFVHQERKQDYTIHARWRIRQASPDKPVFVGVDILDTIIHWHDGKLCPRVRRFTYADRTYDLGKGEILSFRKAKHCPESVVNTVMEMLKDTAKELYGLRPTIKNFNASKDETISAFLYRPYDLNCYVLKRYFKDMDFIPRDCKNAYYLLCEKFGINPPKGLKKIYAQNPYALPMYRTLLGLGFTDYNYMMPFFSGTNIGPIDFARPFGLGIPFFGVSCNNICDYTYYYDNGEDGDMISQAEIDRLLNGGPYEPISLWEILKFSVDLLISERGERSAAHRLLSFPAKDSSRIGKDICSMLYQYGHEMHPKAIEEFLREGFTKSVHDRLAMEVTALEYGHESISYLLEEERLECEINGYVFELPRFTDDIANLGREMRNCVASYIKKARRKNCTIMSVRKGKNYLVCIEIDGSGNSVLQALGPGNEYLTGDLLHVMNYWIRAMDLTDRTDHLQDDDFDRLSSDAFSLRRFTGENSAANDSDIEMGIHMSSDKQALFFCKKLRMMDGKKLLVILSK